MFPELDIDLLRTFVAVVESGSGGPELDKLVAGGKVSDDFIKQLNHPLAEDVFHETLHRRGKTDFHLDRSASRLSGEKLALTILSRQIAHFLAEANFCYLHRCANTTSCVLYFYDTDKPCPARKLAEAK